MKPPATPPRRSIAGALGIALLLVALAACSPAGAPAGATYRSVHRFVDAALGADGLITKPLPVAMVRDETRYVLRAPRRHVLIWPKTLEDPSGNRIVERRQLVPDPIAGAAELLVMSQVRVGSTWLEVTPRIVPTQRTRQYTAVRLGFPIPANPQAKPVSVLSEAYGLGLEDLGRIATPPVDVPAGARLEFGIGVIEPDYGYDPVDFRIEACEGERCERVFEARFDPQDEGGGRFRDHVVALPSLAGTKRSFRFLADRPRQQAPFSLPVWANPALYAPAPRGDDDRSVILLSIDTLRADHLGAYGYAHDTSPFIDERFARGGTLFENPVAAATITTPSHASMFTALSPVTHGTVDGMNVLPSGIPTLAEHARAAGLETAAITENGWLGTRHGFGRGFDSFIENRSPNIMDPEGQVDVTFGQARRWLERNADKRFLLFLHTFQVHTPYAPPPAYRHLFNEHAGRPIDKSSPSELRWMAEYDQEIRYTDDELRRLFATIDALGLARSVVFVLTSDHGEAFLEHGFLEHGARLDEEAVRVPLLLWGKGIRPGLRIEPPVAHVDLLPTILDLLGVPKPSAIEGVSLLGLIEGRGGEEAFRERALFSEARGTLALGRDRSMQRFEAPGFMVRIGDRKLARYPAEDGGEHRYEYYDLASDPREQRDLFASRAEDVEAMRRLLDDYERRALERREKIDRGDASAPERVFLDPRQEEKLRALGYIE